MKRRIRNNFNKTLLQSYIITRCERRLFFELSKNKPNYWIDPVRLTKKPKRVPITSDVLQKLGKDYEQEVYSYLKPIKNCKFREIERNVDKLCLEITDLVDYFQFLEDNPSEDLILLEYEFKTPSSFFFNLFPSKPEVIKIPVDFGNQRPDIMILGNGINNYLIGIFELLPNGNFQKIPEDRLNNRFGISIFDIKKTQEERIGKKHFVEIFYYMWTLAVFLKDNKLDDRFYVRANFNGIFPEQPPENLKLIGSVEDIIKNELITLISWEESRRIFLQIFYKIRSLWRGSPCPIESIPLNLHQGCGYCQYIEDCKDTLGCNEVNNPGDWSLRLIPFTSPSIAEQLISEFGFKTISDVVNKIDSCKIGNIPKPLYSELPHLKLKAQALIENKIIYPPYDETHSYAIPRYSPIALNFGVEYDINNDKVFVVGIYYKIFVHVNLKYSGRFDAWCKLWRNALEYSIPIEQILLELNNPLVWDIPLETAQRFKRLMESLDDVEISLIGEKSDKGTELVYEFAKVNEDLSRSSEALLTMEMIEKLYSLLEMSTIIEEYIVSEGYEKDRYFRPDTSLFYWGPQQLRHFEEMEERNLDYIINDNEIRPMYEQTLLYFRPLNTEVANPYQHKKLFDVQKFAESCIGFPDIINYTWHGIAEKLFNMKFSPKFWIPHFNFLDLNNWLRFLSPDNTLGQKNDIRLQIRHQILRKLKMIDQIRYQFQTKGTSAISENARPVNRTIYRSVSLSSHYHAIAHVWYLFSLRTNSLQMREAEFYRTMFPDFSIGKMAAARVTNLQASIVNSGKFRYKFDIKGLSANMKLKEGDIVLLIPQQKRDLKLTLEVYNWRVQISEITWDPAIKGNHIETEETDKNVIQQCKDEDILTIPNWYLYPLTFDAWSNKLSNRKNTGLFQRDYFGESWLGHRLAYLWKIRSNPELVWPSEWESGIAAVYLFAPDLLNSGIIRKSSHRLLTSISPAPDPSQEKAIMDSLNYTISAILGPPGSGKSQTIAALVDEFLCLRKKEGITPTRILITSFSYAALRVIIEKIREYNRDKQGNPTISSQTQLIFMRSESQDAIESKQGCRDVDDLLRIRTSWRFNGQTHVVTPKKLLEEQLEDSCIIFGNAHQLYYLNERVQDNFAFDLICVDEASQLPTDHFLSSIQFVYKQTLRIFPRKLSRDSNLKIEDFSELQNLSLDKNAIKTPLTKIVIVGDNNQLPPVRNIIPPRNLESVLSSLFSYYVDGHHIPSTQLKVNYRSHQDIVEFTSSLGFYQDLQAYKGNATNTLEGKIENIKTPWVKKILSPDKIVCAITHDTKFEIGISILEANLVCQIVKGYFNMISPKNKAEEIEFWTENVGVVAPHNAQGRTIIQKLFQELESLTFLDRNMLMTLLKNTVYSVEKFQGSDRSLIITSIGLSDIDKINDETDFIFDVNRFNVLTSRAKNKLIFIASEEMINFIPEESTRIENASKFNFYVNKFCNKEEIFTIYDDNKNLLSLKFRYKQ